MIKKKRLNNVLLDSETELTLTALLKQNSESTSNTYQTSESSGTL